MFLCPRDRSTRGVSAITALVSRGAVAFTKLSDILEFPVLRSDVVCECGLNVFNREDLASCERTEDVRGRDQNISIVECEIDKQIVGRSELVRDEEVRR